MKNTRIKFAFTHLLISLVIACLSACLVFLGWYAFPFGKILRVDSIYILLIIIDVICGPLMTLIIANPKKDRQKLLTDIVIIGIVQLSALLYGLYSLYQARPVMTVFEKDRFVLVQANEVQMNELDNALSEFKPLKWMGTRMASAREPISKDEMLESIESSLGGVDVSLRPNWWVNYNQARPDVITKAKNVSVLIDKHPEKKVLIEQKLSELELTPNNTLYLPFVSSKNYDWIAFLDDEATIVGYLNVSGF